MTEIIGKKFGKLTIVEQSNEKRKPGRTFWVCICECGNKKTVNRKNLIAGNTRSCGCLPKGKSLTIDQIFAKYGKHTVNGCLEVDHNLDRDGRPKYGNKFLSRMVYERENGKIPEKKHVCHTCDNPKCVNIDHLWVGTNEENRKDSLIKGRIPKNESHWNCKLKDEEIEYIRNMKKIRRQKDLASEFNVDQSTISYIQNDKRRKKFNNSA